MGQRGRVKTKTRLLSSYGSSGFNLYRGPTQRGGDGAVLRDEVADDVVEAPSGRPDVAVVQVACERAKFVTGFSRWVKGQVQGLQPGGFKLWVNWIRATCTGSPPLVRCAAPRAPAFSPPAVPRYASLRSPPVCCAWGCA
jgi:hypothetical protein